MIPIATEILEFAHHTLLVNHFQPIYCHITIQDKLAILTPLSTSRTAPAKRAAML